MHTVNRVRTEPAPCRLSRPEGSTCHRCSRVGGWRGQTFPVSWEGRADRGVRVKAEDEHKVPP